MTARSGIVIALVLASGAARATEARPGEVASLTVPDRARLQAEVDRARRAQPEIFARVRALAGIEPRNYRRTRARRPEVTRELTRLGAAALMPMLEVMALGGYPRALDREERHALELGLLEAVGRLGDPRAAAVLVSALGESDEPEAAARALGRLCGAGEAGAQAERLLVGRAAPQDALRAAAIEGLGWCRTVGGVERLASIVDGRDVDSARRAIAALGVAGSSWAWQGGAPGDAAEYERVSAIAARALVRAAAAALLSPEELAPSARMFDERAIHRAAATVRAGAAADAQARIDQLDAAVRR